MPDSKQNVRDSWPAYQDCLSAIHRFLDEIRVHSGEAWIGDVCLGSPGDPWVRAPLRNDPVALVERSIRQVEMLVASLMEAIQRALFTSRQAIDELKREGDVDEADWAPLIDRIHSLEGLLAGLTEAGSVSPMACHPGRLIRWYEILRGSFVAGDPRIRVRVVVTYMV